MSKDETSDDCLWEEGIGSEADEQEEEQEELGLGVEDDGGAMVQVPARGRG